MSDRVRAALSGGGYINVCIQTMHHDGLRISAQEYYDRMDGKESKLLTTAELDAAEDPDALIRDTAVELVQKAHIRYEARKEEKA